MLETLSTAGSLPSIDKLESIARKTQFIRRQSPHFTAQGFLLTLIQTVLRGNNSLNHIAAGLGQHQDKTLSRQAIHQRIDESASSFLLSVLFELIKKRTQSICIQSHTNAFQRILIEDTTVLPMHKSNHATFPGNGNGHNTAGAKVRLLADWLSGDVLECAIHTARSADQGLSGEVLDHLQSGDLVLRDMGFFHLETLNVIEEHNAFWLSRLPASVTAYNSDGTELDHLLRKATKNQFQCSVHLGQHRQKQCRLIATRLSKQQTEKNRRQRRRDSKRHGAKPSKRGLLRDEWSILVTNLTNKEASPKMLHQLYSLRWNIEIQFRGFKQSCRFEKSLNHTSSHSHMECLIFAALIYQILTLQTHSHYQKQMIGRTTPTISYEKLCDALAHHLLLRTKCNLKKPFEPDLRHITHDQRRRKTLYTKSLQALA